MTITQKACVALALTIGLGLGTAHAEESWLDTIKGCPRTLRRRCR